MATNNPCVSPDDQPQCTPQKTSTATNSPQGASACFGTTTTLQPTQAISGTGTQDSDRVDADVAAINARIIALSDQLSSSSRSDACYHDTPNDQAAKDAEEFISDDPAIQADSSVLGSRKIAFSSLRAKKRRNHAKITDSDHLLDTITESNEPDLIPSSSPQLISFKFKTNAQKANDYSGQDQVSPALPSSPPEINPIGLGIYAQKANDFHGQDNDSPTLPSSPSTFNPPNLSIDPQSANAFREQEHLESPDFLSSPPLTEHPNIDNFRFPNPGTMSNNKGKGKEVSDAEINDVVAKTGSMGIRPSSTGNINPDTSTFFRTMNTGNASSSHANKKLIKKKLVTKKNDVTGGYLSGGLGKDDAEEEEELQLPALPGSKAARSSPPDNRANLKDTDIDEHFAKMGEIQDQLAKCKTQAEKDALRIKALNEILLAQRAIIRECLLWDNGKLPIPQTRYRIEYELQRFASKPMCPWMYTRTLVHSPRFLELIHWFEAVLCQFLDKVNRNVAPAMVPVLGLDKQEFLGVISEVLCKNMVPVLYLKDSAIPKLEHILEKVDSLYDPVCLNPVEDEDEPLELGMARGLWKNFSFIEKVAAMRIANDTWAYESSGGANNVDRPKDNLPCVFTANDDDESITYLLGILGVASACSDEIREFFNSDTFVELACAFEGEVINTFVSKLKEVGATCRKKVLVLAIAEHVAQNFGVAKQVEEGAGLAGAVTYDENDVKIGAADDQELADAMSDVVGAVQGGDEEVDDDDDDTMRAFV